MGVVVMMVTEPNYPAKADALFVDLYELTMMQAYLREGLSGTAAFSLFVRRLPPTRNYLIACGLETVLDFLEHVRFSKDDVSYLSSLSLFTPEFLDWLLDFHFTGDVFAVAEGTPVFGNEPILEVVAPLPQAQYFETFVMNQIHLQTLLASKAARVVTAACGRKVIDFGARRMHGTDAANKAARAFYIAGVAATSNLSASRRYGVPATGTMGHSYIQAHETECDAYRAFARIYPETVLLIDTYDTIEAAKKIVSLARTHNDGFRISAVRLDSGDLVMLAREVRSLLDAAGLKHVEIVASGGLDEIEINRLITNGAPIDCFGVGTSMGVSSDAPGLDIAYKLTEYEGVGRLKLSKEKATLPGRKQIFRREHNGKFVGDEIARAGETRPDRPLLRCVMKNGRRVFGETESLETIRERVCNDLASLPEALLSLKSATPHYPVEISAALAAYDLEVRYEIVQRHKHRIGRSAE
jgi:nicotinate phosphoribosyltransferase